MNDDDFAAELSKRRPMPVDPELADRVVRRLRARRRSRVVAVAAGVAALVGVGLVLRTPHREPAVAIECWNLSGLPDVVPPVSGAPMLVEYQLALARSPEALEALLDRPTPGIAPETWTTPRTAYLAGEP